MPKYINEANLMNYKARPCEIKYAIKKELPKPDETIMKPKFNEGNMWVYLCRLCGR